ncbi:hypothetical protein F2P81_002246 [Scophthalmus maximus]|uniref:Serine/threonine-protein kinase 11-interacting protein n=1 Tax=Scophthalmus maximus TaxID=52904 RepID=A0A6A4TGC4_SCOMX|nr:hypothetical protein F2P81_002246 [Scophthalmus maximus]
MAVSPSGQSSLVHSLATLLRNDGDLVLDGSSTLTLPACSLQQLTRLFEQYLLSRSQQHGFLALPSHPADTASLLQLQFLFDVLQKTISLKLINPPEVRLQSVVKIFPFKSLKCLELKRIPPHCLEGLRGVYSQLEVFTCSKSLSSLEELLSLCGGDLSSALPWLELHTLNFSFNSIVCLDQSLSLLNVLKSMDLSHNKIQECAEFLKPLSELERLNLGYNCLQRAPTLGPSARVKLLTLILRNNELETINGIVLPHQQEIERMSSFREQLGEDWLRYQHHLDGASPSVITSTISQTQPTLHQTLTNGFSTITPRPSTSPAKQPSPPSMEVPEVLPPPLLSSEPRTETSYMDADQETDSTLQWPEKSTLYTESTLEDSAVDGQEVNQAVASSEPSPDSQRSARAESRDTKEEEEEEEEDLGVDLCHPLLVGVLSDKEEEDDAGKGKKRRREVFLCIKQGLVLEVDMQRGKEKCRLELDSLARVETTKAAWTHLDTDEMLPAVELHFDYINREKRRRRYVLLDDDPQQALQALTDVLCHVAEENQRRYSELCPGRVHLQCLRCRLDFTLQGEGSEEEVGGGARRRGAVMIPEGREERDREGPTDAEFYDDSKGKSHICPECGSDHVVQLADQSDHYSSTPIDRPPRAKSEDDHLDITQSARGVKKDDDTNASLSSSPILETSTATEDPTFATAQGSSFLNGDENDSLSYNTECQSKEDLAGSYHYTSIGATTPEVQAQPSGRSTPNDDVDLLSEDYESVDHRLKLFLDVEVFEEEEELHSFLKMSAVRFGELGEVPSLLVVSNQRIYILEMKQEMHRGQLSDWLQKRDSHPIMELSYLEVGLGSQSIHMEFGDGVVAYTLLVRDSLRCKRFFGLLTGIVREMAHKSDSKLKSISTTRLNPQHHLWPLVCDDIQADVEDGQLQFFYILAFVLQEDVWMPLTVLATRETLYLLREDHQWTKSSSVQTAVEDNEPSSGNVTVLETLPISCVSSVHLWPSDERRMDLKLYDETVKQEKTWRVRLESAELLQGLLAWVRAQWEAMFGVKLHTGLQDEAAQWGMA